jgi:hypothetical protein
MSVKRLHKANIRFETRCLKRLRLFFHDFAAWAVEELFDEVR